MINSLELDTNSLSVVLTFFPVKVDEKGDCFIPTGTSSAPLGISTTKCQMVLFFTSKDKFVVYDKKRIMDFIRENWKSEEKLQKKLDDRYEKFGVSFNIKSLEE